MRLPDFILANVELIMTEWEEFARSVWPESSQESGMDVSALRDHAADILKAAAADMKSAQTDMQQRDKSLGQGVTSESGARVDRASDLHGSGRGTSGFELTALVAEYRALRASVLRLWRASNPSPDLRDIEDITRFDECIDQSLAEAVRSYIEQVRGYRQ